MISFPFLELSAVVRAFALFSFCLASSASENQPLLKVFALFLEYPAVQFFLLLCHCCQLLFFSINIIT